MNVNFGKCVNEKEVCGVSVYVKCVVMVFVGVIVVVSF